MNNDQMQPNPSGQPEQAEPEQEGRQAQQSQAGAPTEPRQRVTPGRRPLFRS